MGYAVDENNIPLYIAKFSGQVTLVDDCQHERIAAYVELFKPDISPFDRVQFYGDDLGDHYGHPLTMN